MPEETQLSPESALTDDQMLLLMEMAGWYYVPPFSQPLASNPHNMHPSMLRQASTGRILFAGGTIGETPLQYLFKRFLAIQSDVK